MGEYFDADLVRFSKGSPKNLGKSDNKVMSWKQLRQLFLTPTITPEKFKQYKNAGIEEKNRLKGVAGWFLGAHVKDGKRKAQNIEDRDIITLDLDNISVDEFNELKDGSHYLCQYEFFAHTTRSHTPEEPRVRIVLLVDGTIDRERYEPVTRIMAYQVDERMETVDPVSFRLAQMMYLPTRSKDQEYDRWANRGRKVDVEEVLELWPDWRDLGSLPRAEKEENDRITSIKAEDPTEKPGLIGAFCRAYGIEDVIAEFLPDVYGDPDPNSTDARYTYLGGHSMYGAVIYDDLFLYSWHGTDPAVNTLCNAWDLVRIHKFSDKDAKTDDSTPINDRPSQKAMLEYAKGLKGVQKQQVHDALDLDAMFENLEGVEVEEFVSESEMDDLDLDDEQREMLGLEPLERKNVGDLPDFPGRRAPRKSRKRWIDDLEPGMGGIKPTPHNLALILTHDIRFRGVMRYNAFSNNLVSVKELKCQIKEVPRFPVRDKVNGDPWTDDHDAAIKTILSAPRGKGNIGYGITPADNHLMAAIRMVAKEFQFHPVVDRLLSLPEWDGTDRNLWIDYMDAPDTPYHRETSRLFLCGAIARLFTPGIQWDYVPVLISGEDRRKSTFVSTLAFGLWGAEFSAPLHDQQASAEQMMGTWFLEMAEITNIKKSDTETQKAFITRTRERVRLAYDRRMSDLRRQCVFIGTTNEHEFLRAPDNRRFWPIDVVRHEIDTDKLEADLDQIWAQGLYQYRELIAQFGSAEKIHFRLSPKARAEAKAYQESARVQTTDDVDLPAIIDFLESPTSLQHYLAADGFEDLEAEDTRIQRCSVIPYQLIEEALAEELPKNENVRRGRAITIGLLMNRVPGWVSYSKWAAQHEISNDKLKIPGYSRGRGYVRADATPDEVKRGYRLASDDLEDLL